MLAHPANPDELGLSENLPVPGSRRDDIDDRPLKVSLTRFENLVKKAPGRTGDVIGALVRHCVTVRDCPMSLRPSLARKGIPLPPKNTWPEVEDKRLSFY